MGVQCVPGCRQQALTVPQKAAAPAALLGGGFCIALQQLRSPPPRLPQVQPEPREAPDPAVLVEGRGRAEALGEPGQPQEQQQQRLCRCQQHSHGPVQGLRELPSAPGLRQHCREHP